MSEYEVVKKIKLMDMKKDTVIDLLELIKLLEHYIEINESPFKCTDFLKMDDLPSLELPNDISESYPIWSIDSNDNCLVGEGHLEIMSLDEIRYGYE